MEPRFRNFAGADFHYWLMPANIAPPENEIVQLFKDETEKKRKFIIAVTRDEKTVKIADRRLYIRDDQILS